MTHPVLVSRPFGHSGLRVPALCVGTAPLGDMPEAFGFSVSAERALETLRAVFRGPITFIDTSNNYGGGTSERLIGRVLREMGGVPDGWVIATKADRDMATNDFSGDRVKRSVEESLERLGLDRLPFVYIHDPEHTTFEHIMERGGALDVLQHLQSQGVVGALGISGGPVDMLIRYVETGAFAAVETHNRFTLLNRAAGPLLDVCAARGVAVANAAVYASGILAKGPDASARYAYQNAPPAVIDRVRAIASICQEFDVPLPAAALQFSIRDPRVTTTVVGMTRPERVAQTLEMATWAVPDDLWRRLREVPYDTEDPEANRWKA